MDNYKVIILLGQRVRSGTNFVGSTLAMHPEVVSIPPDISTSELNLFPKNSVMGKMLNEVMKLSNTYKLSEEEENYFWENYGATWIELLIKHYNISSKKTIFIKSPYIDHLDLWKRAFPNSKIAIIYRDGRDNVISSIKASNDARAWYTIWVKFRKTINYCSGRSFLNHLKAWKVTAHGILQISETKHLKKFKYEELNNSEEGILQLLKHYDLKNNKEIINKCLGAPVVGSSFGKHSTGYSHPKWQPDQDKHSYIFSKKWVKWNFVKKTVFKLIAGKELVSLGYEKNNKW